MTNLAPVDPSAFYAKLLPLPSGRPSVLPYDEELMPNALQPYIRDVSNRAQCSPEFVAVAVIAIVAGTIGRKFAIHPKAQDDWLVIPTIWAAAIGRPSAKKSPALEEPLRAAKSLQDEALSDHKRDLKAYEASSKLATIEQKATEDSAKKLAKAGERDKALALLTTAEFAEPEKPTAKRTMLNDATPEKLGEVMSENPAGVMVFRDELSGFLSDLSQESRQSERAFLLTCFNGNSSFTWDRIGRGTVTVPNCCVSILGGIQPAKLAAIIGSTLSGAGDDGLLQRFQLAVWPDQVKQSYVDAAPDLKARAAYEDILHRLDALPYDSEAGPTALRFSADAQLLYIDWYESNITAFESEDIHPAMESHLIKMQATVPKLALIFALMNGQPETVDAKSLARALEWADFLISHAERIYSLVTHGEADTAKIILDRREKLPPQFKKRDIQRKNWGGVTDIQGALDLLEDCNYLLSTVHQPGPNGGSPSTVYAWNPRVG